MTSVDLDISSHSRRTVPGQATSVYLRQAFMPSVGSAPSAPAGGEFSDTPKFGNTGC